MYGLFYRDTISTGGPAIRPAFQTGNNFFTFSLQGSETHNFSANTLNEAFFGITALRALRPQAATSPFP